MPHPTHAVILWSQCMMHHTALYTCIAEICSDIMVSILDAVLLGIIQGITEWLPISSSAHLALAQHFLGIGADVAFDIILHLGTLLAVVIYYRKDIIGLVAGAARMQKKELLYIAYLIICAVPTAIIGLAFKDFFEGMFGNVVMIAFALFITGTFLIIAGKVNDKAKNGPDAKKSFIIGVAQGIAVAPGISRSGATIGTGLILGMGKEEAARFSFLGGIAPIAGAVVLEGKNAVIGSSVDLASVIIGFAVSAIVGYFSIALLLRIIRGSKFQWFGYYCIALAVVSALLSGI